MSPFYYCVHIHLKFIRRMVNPILFINREHYVIIYFMSSLFNVGRPTEKTRTHLIKSNKWIKKNINMMSMIFLNRTFLHWELNLLICNNIFVTNGLISFISSRCVGLLSEKVFQRHLFPVPCSHLVCLKGLWLQGNHSLAPTTRPSM